MGKSLTYLYIFFKKYSYSVARSANLWKWELVVHKYEINLEVGWLLFFMQQNRQTLIIYGLDWGYVSEVRFGLTGFFEN